MVLEDDVRFEPYFRQKVKFILSELRELNVDWDLMYVEFSFKVQFKLNNN